MNDDIEQLKREYNEILIKHNELHRDFYQSKIDFDKKLLEIEYKFTRIADNIEPLKDSVYKVHQSISGEAGTTDKIGIIGQLSSLSAKIDANNAKTDQKWIQTDKVLKQLQDSQKEQQKINLDAAKKYSIIGILVLIVVQILAHLFSK